MSKFENFIKEYGHNKFIVAEELDSESIYYLLDLMEDYLMIVWKAPERFCDDRVFLGDLIADSYEEIFNYFTNSETDIIVVEVLDEH